MKRGGDGHRGGERAAPLNRGAGADSRVWPAAGRRAGDSADARTNGQSKKPRESSGAGAPERSRAASSRPQERRPVPRPGEITRNPAKVSEDEALMRRVAAGEEAAVTELYDRFASLVYRMAHQVLNNRGELEDVMQEVFVILWRTAARYDAARAALVTWVMLITRRRLVDRLRRRHRLDEWTRDASPQQSQPCDVLLEQDDEFERLMSRVKALPELQRVVLTRVYLHGQTLRQIGEHLGTPLGTIKTALNRGLCKLRAEVGDPLSDPLPLSARRSRRLPVCEDNGFVQGPLPDEDECEESPDAA